MPKFWWVPLPGEQSNPKSRQDICRFPDSRTVFWSNPRSQKYATRPCSEVFAARMTKLITARARKNQTPDHGSHACKCSQRPFDTPPSVCSVRNAPTLWSLAATSSVGFRVLHYESIDECAGRERPWRALALLQFITFIKIGITYTKIVQKEKLFPVTPGYEWSG